MSRISHKKAQSFITDPNATIEFVEIDLGTSTNSAERSNILRHFEQKEYLNIKAQGYKMLNSNNPEAIKKRERNKGYKTKHSAKKKAKIACPK